MGFHPPNWRILHSSFFTLHLLHLPDDNFQRRRQISCNSIRTYSLDMRDIKASVS